MAGEWDVTAEAPVTGSQWDVASERPIRKPKPQPADRGDFYLNTLAKLPGQVASIPGLALDAMNSAMGIGEHFLRGPERQANQIMNQNKPAVSTPNTFPVDRPLGGSESIRNAFNEMLGVQDIKAPSLADEYGGLALELGGTGGPFSVRNIATAPHKIPAIVSEIGSILGGTAGGVTGEFLGGDVGKAVGVGLGSTAPTIGPWASSKLASKFSEAGKRSFAEGEAGRILKPAMESNLNSGKNMEEAQTITDAINAATGRGGRIDPLQGTPFEPTIGARSNANVVQELEHSVASKNPANLSRYATRADQNQRSLDEATTNLLGDKTAEALPRQAGSRLSNAQRQIEQRLSQLEAQQKGIAASTEGGDLQGKGEALRNQYWKNRQGVGAQFKQGYNDLYDMADKMGVKVDMSRVNDIAANIAKADQNVYQDMPNTFGKLRAHEGDSTPFAKPFNSTEVATNAIALAKSGGGSQKSFREFHSFWKEVNREYGKAARANDTQKMQYLQQLKGPLDEMIGQMEGGGLGDVSQTFRSLNKDYGERYAKVFKEGIGGKVADVGKYGATMDDAKVVERFFTPDGMDDFNRIYGSDANAQQLMKDGVLGMFAKRAVDETTGKIKPGAAEAFLRTHAETLSKVPEVDQLLRNANTRNEALIDRSIRLEQGRRALDKSTLAKVAGSEDVGGLLTNASNSPKEMKRLFALVKGKDQRQALARSLADELPNIAQKASQEPYAYLLSQEANLKPIMDQIGPNHWNNLKTIGGGQTLVARAPVPASVGSPNPKGPLESVTGTSAYGGFAAYRNIIRGRSSIRQELIGVAGKLGVKIKSDMTAKVMNDAIYDPELAASLANIVKGRANQAASNKLGNWLQTNAFRTAVVAGDNQEEQK